MKYLIADSLVEIGICGQYVSKFLIKVFSEPVSLRIVCICHVMCKIAPTDRLCHRFWWKTFSQFVIIDLGASYVNTNSCTMNLASSDAWAVFATSVSCGQCDRLPSVGPNYSPVWLRNFLCSGNGCCTDLIIIPLLFTCKLPKWCHLKRLAEGRVNMTPAGSNGQKSWS